MNNNSTNSTSSKPYLTKHEQNVAQSIRIENLEDNLNLLIGFLEDASSVNSCRLLANTMQKQIKTLRENS